MSKCCQKRLGSRGAGEPGAALNPTDEERALLKATSGHQTTVVESFDRGGEGGTNSCKGLVDGVVGKGRKAGKRGKNKCKRMHEESRCRGSVLSGVVGRRREGTSRR